MCETDGLRRAGYGVGIMGLSMMLSATVGVLAFGRPHGAGSCGAGAVCVSLGAVAALVLWIAACLVRIAGSEMPCLCSSAHLCAIATTAGAVSTSVFCHASSPDAPTILNYTFLLALYGAFYCAAVFGAHVGFALFQQVRALHVDDPDAAHV